MTRQAIAISVMLCGGLLRAAPPTQSDLNDALAAARTAWGVEVPGIEIRLEPLNACKLSQFVSMRAADIVTTDVETTLTFGDGQTSVSKIKTFLIQINSECDWHNLDLNAFVLHEYAHALFGNAHSKDRHSIRYFAVEKSQRITKEDRALLAVTVARR